jgi:hypothetical protein
MPVKIMDDVASPDGHELFARFRSYADDLDVHCACPGGRYCEVVLEEFQGGLYDLFVIRAGQTLITPENWIAIPKQGETCYVRSFSRPTALELANAVADLIRVPVVGIR